MKTNSSVARLWAVFTCVLWASIAGQVEAQAPGRFGFELGIGMHAFYLPGIGAKYQSPQPTLLFSVYRGLNRSQSLQTGLTLGYTRNARQGDGLFAQARFQYNPLIGKHIEPAISAGIGYQYAFYPAASLQWDGENWTKGAAGKGVLQAPVRLSLGFRKDSPDGRFTPFVAWQANVLFGYSPDLSPLPVSVFMAGLKYSPIRK